MNVASRREFLEFMGLTGAVLAQSSKLSAQTKKIESLEIHHEDKLLTSNGMQSKVLLRWQDPINSKQEFGINNDYIALLSSKYLSENEAYLWVNHEYPMPFFQNSKEGEVRIEDIKNQQASVGGSLLVVRWNIKSKMWEFNSSPKNIRFDGKTKIPFANGIKIKGKDYAIGTMGNCCGGKTPWNTFLSCEENYKDYYGEVSIDAMGSRTVDYSEAKMGWYKFFDYPPEHYGWVVEIDPVTHKAQKLTALGRFAHEGATLTLASDGRAVVYMGDDAAQRCIYKFIADKPGSLVSGELFVADLKNGKWLSLDRDKNPKLRAQFNDPLSCLIHTRKAAEIVGGTPSDRPEGIAIHPKDQSVFVCLTNDFDIGNLYGSILKIEEKNSDPLSLEFKSSHFLMGGKKLGFSCPDNIQFDSKGNLWFTTDMPFGKKKYKEAYKEFGNNSLFLVPASGPQAGEVLRIVCGPVEAELTGICLDEEHECMFLSVQHPGEESRSKNKLTSHWPDGGNSIPKSAVVQILGLPI